VPDLPIDRLHSEFVLAPYREFKTIRLGNDDIQRFNAGGSPPHMFSIDIHDKIVRMLYTCTDEDNKALNRSIMEKELYALGAFWVSEISPEKITITTNKNELSEKTDPEANLINYLNEKAIPDDQIGPIVEAARSIIAEAVANNATTHHRGIFIPVEIDVKNYRNYEAERFDFSDVKHREHLLLLCPTFPEPAFLYFTINPPPAKTQSTIPMSNSH